MSASNPEPITEPPCDSYGPITEPPPVNFEYDCDPIIAQRQRKEHWLTRQAIADRIRKQDKYHSGDSKEPDLKGIVKCGICLECVKKDGGQSMFTPCIHGFHATCLMQWIQYNVREVYIPCPICKTDISGLAGPRNPRSLYEPNISMEHIVSTIEHMDNPNFDEVNIDNEYPVLRRTQGQARVTYPSLGYTQLLRRPSEFFDQRGIQPGPVPPPIAIRHTHTLPVRPALIETPDTQHYLIGMLASLASLHTFADLNNNNNQSSSQTGPDVALGAQQNEHQLRVILERDIITANTIRPVHRRINRSLVSTRPRPRPHPRPHPRPRPRPRRPNASTHTENADV
jgi:hypothetical protein